MAIIARRLVEENDWFKHPKIAVIGSPNIPATNRTALTTISSLYDTLKLIFTHYAGTDRNLRFRRPTDERLDDFYKLANEFFKALSTTFPPVGELFKSDDPIQVTSQHRGDHGGHVLFRVLGLELITRLAIKMAEQHQLDLPVAIKRLKSLPFDLASPPYKDVIWDSARRRMNLKGKSTAQRVLYYLYDLGPQIDDVVAEYALAVGSSSAAREELIMLKTIVQAK